MENAVHLFRTPQAKANFFAKIETKKITIGHNWTNETKYIQLTNSSSSQKLYISHPYFDEIVMRLIAKTNYEYVCLPDVFKLKENFAEIAMVGQPHYWKLNIPTIKTPKFLKKCAFKNCDLIKACQTKEISSSLIF